MGTWGVLALDNDRANDWAYDLDKVTDLALVESALAELEEVGDGYLDQDLACHALAACEVVARLQGRPGYANAYTENIDRWVAAHPMGPPETLVARCLAAIERTLSPDSELRELWEEGECQDWHQAMADLRTRVAGP